jgi:hypothetical protein
MLLSTILSYFILGYFRVLYLKILFSIILSYSTLGCSRLLYFMLFFNDSRLFHLQPF